MKRSLIAVALYVMALLWVMFGPYVMDWTDRMKKRRLLNRPPPV